MIKKQKAHKDEENKNEKSRIPLIDYVRGIAILLVVFGHNIQYGSGYSFLHNKDFFENVFFKVIYSFHMPLFALVSGYLFFWSMKKPTKKVLAKRVTSILLPIICWTTLECVCRAFMPFIRHELILNEFLKNYMGKIMNNFWFLWAIFWCSLIVLLVEKAFRGSVLIYVLTMLLILFTPDKYSLFMDTYMYPYFVAGFLFNKFNGKDAYLRIMKKDEYLLGISVIIFCILFLFYGYNSYIYKQD